MKCVFIYIPKI